MTVKVLYFSVLRDVTGCEFERLDLDSRGADLGRAVALLEGRHPGLSNWRGRLLCAVNQDYADAATPLQDGDELALMPPVQGG